MCFNVLYCVCSQWYPTVAVLLPSDWCGVCGGDNSTCQINTGALEDVQNWGYSDVIIIPEGAARIEITQHAYHDKSEDDNYLGLSIKIKV